MAVVREGHLPHLVEEITLPLIVGIVVVDVVVVPHLIPLLGLILLGLPLEQLGPPQVCNKMGHTALQCYNRFNHAYHGESSSSQLAAFVASSPFLLIIIGTQTLEQPITSP